MKKRQTQRHRASTMFALSCENILKLKEKVQQQFSSSSSSSAAVQQQFSSSSADILATQKEATMENSSYATSYRSTAIIVSNVQDATIENQKIDLRSKMFLFRTSNEKASNATSQGIDDVFTFVRKYFKIKRKSSVQQFSSSVQTFLATMEYSTYATSYRSTAIIVCNVIGCDDRIKLKQICEARCFSFERATKKRQAQRNGVPTIEFNKKQFIVLSKMIFLLKKMINEYRLLRTINYILEVIIYLGR